jgi:hypothetical protein
MLTNMLADCQTFLGSVLSGPQLSLVVGLTAACAVIAVAIPVYASRGKLHVPGYVGLSFAAFAVGLVSARISGARVVTGTAAGMLLSIVFFLLMATTVGSVLAVVLYRHPPET